MTDNIAVPPEGPRDAKIAIVGEAPGQVELKQGRPFVGPSGQLLNKVLSRSGIRRSSCYITNVIKSRKIQISRYYKDKNNKNPTEELLQLWEDIEQELEEINPDLTIVLGAEALKAVMKDPTVSIGEWRGSILKASFGKYIPMYHPAHVIRQYENFPILCFDMDRAADEFSRGPELELPERTYLTNPSLSQIRDFVDRCKQAEWLAFDIETAGSGSRFIDCIALAYSSDVAMSIPIAQRNGEPCWSIDDEAEVWRMLTDILEDPSVKKIGQNAQYDIIFLQRSGINVRNLALDTMNLANVIYPELPKGLDFLVSIYTREPFYKDTIQSDRWVYNAKDAALTYEVAMAQIEDAKEIDVLDFYYNHVHPLLQIYIDIHELGVKIDEEKLSDARAEVEKKLEELQSELNSLAGKELNVYSSKQMKEFLYETLNFKPRYGKTGNPTADANTIKELYRKTHNRALELILEVREHRKLLSSYLNVDYDDDGRLRSAYLVSGTETGRLSSRKSVDGKGLNLQTIPAGVCRECYVPDEGYTFVGADLGQAENRVVAYASGDPNMLKVVNSGGDIHRTNAAMIFDKNLEDITYEERQLGKRITHGANYMMGPITFARFAELPTADGKRLLQQYHDTYPLLRQWHRETQDKVRKERMLENPFGRKRTFMGRLNDSTFRDAIAYIPQSTVADAIHRATYSIHARLPHPARIILQLHDSLVIQCLPEQVEEVKQIIKEEFERPFQIGNRTLSIPADVKVGDNWDVVA